MTTRTKFVLLSLLFGLPTIPLGPYLWPPLITISQEQLYFFIGVAVFEAIGFGCGLSFLILMWPKIKKVPARFKNRVLAMYLAIGWSLASWWPHDHMHSVLQHSDVWSLLKLEYLFHVSLIVSAVVLAYCFITIVRDIKK